MILSLTGDTIILISTIKYSAIKQHRLIVAVIQHMAACDLLLTVFRVFPSLLSLITDKWVLGEVLCHVQNHVIFICGAVTMVLTCAMTALKLLILKFPIRAGVWSSRVGHKICGALWLLLLVLYTPMIVVNMVYIKDTLHFSYRGYDCDYDMSSPRVPAWFRQYGLVGFIAGTILPLTILLVSSLLLLVVARRAVRRQGGELRWEGVVTVLLTVGVFFVSYLPSGVVILVGRLGVRYSNTTRRGVLYLNYLNIMSNFIVYSLTVRSFRRFLKIRAYQILSLVREQRRWFPERQSEPRRKVETQIEEGSTRAGTQERQACEPLLVVPVVQLQELKREEEDSPLRNVKNEDTHL